MYKSKAPLEGLTEGNGYRVIRGNGRVERGIGSEKRSGTKTATAKNAVKDTCNVALATNFVVIDFRSRVV